MDDFFHQIDIPESFIALYLDPGQSRPRAGRAVILARYEFCEDMAGHLTELARARQQELGVTESDVLERIERGLRDPASGVDGAEARWIVRRLAELAGWPDPG